MRKIIRLGDSTSHGGKVVSATNHMIVGGIPVARMGDRCTCPKKGHNNCVIAEGDPNWTVDGIPVALEGHKTSCGAVLISSAPNTGREDDGGGAGSGSGFLGLTAVSPSNFVAQQKKSDEPFDDRYVLLHPETSEPMPNTAYALILSNGEALYGVSDGAGKTDWVRTDDAPELLELYISGA